LRLAATPIPENDLWIAALARQHSLRLASRDAHFDKVPGLHRVSW
jgi:predicted nucleic acid-binding protein